MFLLSACALCSALALNPSPSPSPSAPPEIAHVYTSERTDSTLRNTARTTYTVTHDQIVRNGYRTVAQALENIPGLTISPLGTIGAAIDFSLRGSSSAQTLVLVDGLPAPGSFSNSVELGTMPTAGVERIEVVEGGGSTLYGTGAIGGIINVITDRRSETSATLRTGSFDDSEFVVQTPNIQYTRITAGNAFGLPDGSTRSDADYSSTAFHGNLERQFGAFDATLRAGIQSDNGGAPGPLSFLTPSARENDENENVDLTLDHRTAQSAATLQAGATSQKIGYYCDAAGDPQCFQPGIAISTDSRVMLDLRNVVRGANNQLLYGIDLSHGFVRADDGYGDIAVDPMAQAALYAEDHVTTAWGSAYAGLRGERDGALGGEISPSAGFVVRVAPDTTFKVNAATAFRAPNATELYFPGYGNAQLHPERAQVADATLVDSSLLGGVSLGWFGNRTRNLIEAEPVAAVGLACSIDPSSFTYEACNVDRAFIEGLTFTAKTVPVNGISATLALTDLYRADDLDTQTRLPNDPVFSATLGLDYAARSQRAFVSGFGIAARSEGARSALSGATPQWQQPIAFTSVDAFLTVRAGERAAISLRGYNLGDERYSAVNGFPLPGRSLLLELTAK
jgi:vitamin B12 transporter